jgi:hypothetical protein
MGIMETDRRMIASRDSLLGLFPPTFLWDPGSLSITGYSNYWWPFFSKPGRGLRL